MRFSITNRKTPSTYSPLLYFFLCFNRKYRILSHSLYHGSCKLDENKKEQAFELVLFFKEEGKLEYLLICCLFPIGNKLNELTFRILSALYPAHFV